MNYSFAQRVSSLKPSAIREILKFTSAPGYIPFAAGNPSPEAFPTTIISEISNNILTNRPIDALQYSITEGYAPLRDHLTNYMKTKHDIGRDFDQILICSGAQQVMNLATMALCDPGDVIICENPSFIGSLNAFRCMEQKLVGVDMEEDGMNLEMLEKCIKENPSCKFIYTIPNFQNPSGITMSLEKRKKLYRLAKENNILILEDNPYGDIRIGGENLPSIKSFDQDGIVIYAGTFSKVLAPGIRVGYAIAPRQIISKMVVCKQTSDVHTNIWGQLLCHEFMTKYDYEAHLENNRNIYREKANHMLDLLDKYIGGRISFTRPEGGLFIWCTLPDSVDMLDFCKALLDKKVAVVPGNAFTMKDTDKTQSFRINFSTPTNEQLELGCKILGETADIFIK
ncbi:MAG: PLP-dependent aminotransferase family protein [bacterium]|nr:PLP-dependent aminotransferase family protein [bacterium]